jgi:NADP-dependent 3-hydroxy acid dehydrogenase YdfG
MSSEKVALITGAGSGIGRATAIAFIEAGWRVALAGRQEETLQETVEKAGGEEQKTLALPTDVTNPAAVADLFQAISDRWGHLDLLFNNAGVFGKMTPIDELEPAEWERVVTTNVTGTFLCAQAAFRTMKAQEPQGGRIINNGSISAHSPRPNAIAYTATKHATTGMTKSIALEGRPSSIACGQIDIGNTATELTASFAQGTLQADGSTMVEPMMDVKHVAKAVLSMAELPLDTNVQFMTIMATNMPFIGRG